MPGRPRLSRPARTLAGSVGCAARGLGHAAATQPNLRIHLAAGMAAMAAAWWLRVSLVEWAVLGLTVALVLVAELLNTAVEVLVDLVSPERRPQAMLIKDIAAGAVLVCCLSALLAAAALLLPRLLDLSARQAGRSFL